MRNVVFETDEKCKFDGNKNKWGTIKGENDTASDNQEKGRVLPWTYIARERVVHDDTEGNSGRGSTETWKKNKINTRNQKERNVRKRKKRSKEKISWRQYWWRVPTMPTDAVW